jgi:copper ion binding protein
LRNIKGGFNSMPKKELKVSGMTCGHCRGAVESALKTLKGVNDVDIDLKTGKVIVDYDDGAAAEHELAEAIRNAGYEVV